MAGKQGDPLAAELAALEVKGSGVAGSKVDLLFGNRPEVLDAIYEAVVVRHIGTGRVADMLSADIGQVIGKSAIDRWVKHEKIRRGQPR